MSISTTEGNTYGLIGANLIAASTFTKILAGDIEPTGHISLGPDERLSVLRQNHFSYEDEGGSSMLSLWEMKSSTTLWKKKMLSTWKNFLMKTASVQLSVNLPNGGWEAESEASQLLQNAIFQKAFIANYERVCKDKVKFSSLLVNQMSFFWTSRPDWIFNPLPTFRGTDWFWKYGYRCIHDRHFWTSAPIWRISTLKKLNFYVGNYDFWKESSELATKLQADRNANAEEKIKQLQEFVAFLNNAKIKIKATSRKKMLDKIELERELFHLVGSTHLSTLKGRTKLVTISWQLKIFLSDWWAHLTISARLIYDKTAYRTERYSNSRFNPYIDGWYWIWRNCQKRGVTTWVGLIYQKTASRDLQVVKVFLVQPSICK